MPTENAPREVAFARTQFAQVMNAPIGRALRVVAGLGLMGVGPLAIGGTAGFIVAAIGLIPIAAGTLDLCLIGPVLGASPAGRDIRAAAR